MRLLFVNHPAAANFNGGDSAIINMLVADLEQQGIAVEVSTAIEPNARGFDLVHLFNTNPVRSLVHQARCLRRQRALMVMTPFYHQMAFMEWAQTASLAAFTMETHRERDLCLQWLADRSFRATHTDGRILSAFDIVPADPEYLKLQQSLIGLVDFLLPGSHLELSHLMRTLGVADRPFEVIPFGMETQFPLGNAERFEQKYGIRDFVLQVSRFDSHKNQPMLVHALRDTSIPLVLVGEFLNREFVKLCQSLGGANVRILPRLSLEDLRDAYAAARVHVLPSFAETCGLVTLEAALSDCNVVCSSTGCEIEYFRNFADYCNPLSIDSIRDAVVRSYESYPEQADRRERFRQWIRDNFDRKRFCQRVVSVYERLLQEKSQSQGDATPGRSLEDEFDVLGPGACRPTAPGSVFSTTTSDIPL